MKYILSGGGTGGHIYPALAIGEEIKKQDKEAKILYVGKRNSLEEELAKKYNFEFQGIDISGLPRKKLNKDTVITFYNLMKGLRQCTKILNEFKPDIVIGTGGYVCAPIVFKAQQKNIKTAIQEQNAYPGKTNKILAKKADYVFINFMEAKKYLNNENIIFTGNPIREVFSHLDRKKSREALKIKDNEKFVFSFGGSGGQESTNNAILEILKKKEKLPFKLTHVTGREHYDYFMEKLKEVPENVEILDYTHRVYDYLSSADLVIASSSAMTLAEISAIGIASVLIPKAYTAGNHQYYNAMSYSNMGASAVIEEKDLNGESLLREINKILDNEEERKLMADNSKKLASPEAVSKIVDIILK
ncbi:undecaprenyldiphospho-muramoylpentapeptide beta-N-acetylglucosaminyltransferase [uncultured Peptoniphilus sp.]|uniref:undecaprenyldiphospho-muramoylpentapeptide beta-N-acetylglucosaminyltransferase n=1 Tax=uncultured Peptoniphilus sp. TaxID=254354 RepID=UPI00258A0A4A|nr:undecaprenyldiphospho-muramoylpentapeptide beta-N-acetylglucosaminyltransferase [uncultured Peptoniphilus sp.]MDU5569667.1 undecaprenyldiphospho-muramoylpentapeptide beta-N-acetylglucosaminyltransferase [Peptoniphilus harei]MDU6782848.1 undecaprenyldiphospho-muramoylpentapeptide beta-N-acetylglucosaminyltransferase [Peptoniphilus harei]